MQNKLSATEAAKYLNVSVATIYAWVHHRSIPVRHHGRRLAFDINELELWSSGQYKFDSQPATARGKKVLEANHAGSLTIQAKSIQGPR